MNILLIAPNTNWNQAHAEAPSQALLILGTLAKNRGHNVKILHMGLEAIPLPDHLMSFCPDVVGITVNTFQVKSARRIARLVREFNPGARIIVGGPHATVWDGENDDLVIGEGETRWLDIIDEHGLKSLDDLPMINYDLITLSDFCGIYPVGAMPTVCMMASRGCPFNCSFCNTPVFWGKQVRYRNSDLIVNEVELLHQKYGVNEVFFQDDTFNLNHPWAMAIFEGLIKKGLSKQMLFKICCRANEKLLTQEFLDLAFKAGVWNIFIGVESGSQEMLNRMEKNLTIPEIKRAFAMIHRTHIQTQASFIVGLPGETWRTLEETDKLIREIKPTRFGWCYFCPFPNTKATEEVTEKGHKRAIDYSEYSYGRVMARTDTLDYEDLKSFGGFHL